MKPKSDVQFDNCKLLGLHFDACNNFLFLQLLKLYPEFFFLLQAQIKRNFV